MTLEASPMRLTPATQQVCNIRSVMITKRILSKSECYLVAVYLANLHVRQLENSIYTWVVGQFELLGI
jgi:hypothetical protein